MIPLIHYIGKDSEGIKELETKLLSRLSRILNYYNMKYNINLDIIVDNIYQNCCFNYMTTSIVMSFSFLCIYFQGEEAKRRHIFKTIEDLSITVFLHEIKHAIDYLLHKDLYTELEKYNLQFQYNELKGHSNYIRYEQLPLEARADLFAHDELYKWIDNKEATL